MCSLIMLPYGRRELTNHVNDLKNINSLLFYHFSSYLLLKLLDKVKHVVLIMQTIHKMIAYASIDGVKCHI